MDLDIVIVNWNAGEQLTRCLESIAQFGGQNVAKVVVVDNASSDGSADELHRFGLPIHVIRNSANLGFALACNQGAALCDGKYLLFLNPDTMLFESSIDTPVDFMEEVGNKDFGMCGVQLVDTGDRVTRTCANFPSLRRFAVEAIGLNKIPGLRGAGVHMSEWSHMSDRSVDHVIGAFYLTRRNVFESLKGFDERFFVYLEDIDFSFRAKQAGWKTRYLTQAQAFHAGGGTSTQVKAARLFYSLRSRIQYSFKHFPHWQAWVLMLITVLVEPLSRSVFSLFRNGLPDVRNTWSGYGMLFRDLPNILSKLRANSAT